MNRKKWQVDYNEIDGDRWINKEVFGECFQTTIFSF